uniref:Uncharacterized protein n=1 Tax=Anguilla anguilla TaxID=7936 RepID=A0A0E9RUW8_ANGAN
MSYDSDRRCPVLRACSIVPISYTFLVKILACLKNKL